MAVQLAIYAGLAAYQVYSGMQQAKGIREQAERQRRIDEENAKLAEFDAWAAEAYGQTQIAQYQKTIDQTQAAGRVSAAAAGVDINSGSLAEVSAENQFTGLMNQLEIEQQAMERGLGYKRQAASIRGQAGQNYASATAKADATQNAAILQGVEAGVTGYGRMASSKAAAKKPAPVSNAGTGDDGDSADTALNYYSRFSLA